jgi:fructoselysine-6-P-deglycase FrlB-like protein
MSITEQEIATQPALWRRAAGAAPALAGVLPARGDSVAVVGCGTSFFIARAWAAARERAGHGRTDAFAASEMPPGRTYDAIVAISRSGTTTEVIQLLRALAGTTRLVALTAVAAAPVADAADDAVVLDYADETSVVQTRFATTALALLLAHVGADVGASAAAAERALTAALPEQLDAVRQWVFLGSGWTVGLAEEAALKLREAAQSWAEAYPAMEYRHGPISVSDEQSLVWPLGPLPAGLREDVERVGATVLDAGPEPLAELVLAQRTAVALAELRGLDPDTPRHLTRSVILPTS